METIKLLQKTIKMYLLHNLIYDFGTGTKYYPSITEN